VRERWKATAKVPLPLNQAFWTFAALSTGNVKALEVIVI
jgi:hypothetical protein